MKKVVYIKDERVCVSKNFRTISEARKELYKLEKDTTLKGIRIIKV